MPTKTLHGPDHQPLKVLGQVSVTLSSKGKVSSQQVYVVKGLEQNLLGLPAIEELNLLAKVAEVRHGPELDDVTTQFPALFSGLGTLNGDFQINLEPDVTLFALHTPRNVPLPLRKKVKDKLSRMECLGSISWCAGMVVIPKQNGKV